MRSHRMGGNSAGGPPIKSFWVPHSCAVLSRMGGGIRSLTPPAPPLPVPCSLHPRSEPLPPNLPPQNRPRSIPTPNSPSSRPERSVVEGPPHFVVACFSCHPERSLARTLRQTQSKDPDELHPTTTLRPFLPQIPGSSVCHSAAPFFLSFRSAAEESAVVFLLVILAQRRGPRPACWLGWKPESPYLPLPLLLHLGGSAGLQPCESSPRGSAGL